MKFYTVLKCLFLSTCLIANLSILDGHSGQQSTTPPATLDELLAHALEHNPNIQAYKDRYRAALEEVIVARSLPDPQLKYSEFVESIQTRTGPQRRTIQLMQRFPWFGKIKNKEAVARAESKALSFGLEHRILMLERDLSLLYYDYAYLGKAVELTNANLKLLKN